MLNRVFIGVSVVVWALVAAAAVYLGWQQQELKNQISQIEVTSPPSVLPVASPASNDISQLTASFSALSNRLEALESSKTTTSPRTTSPAPTTATKFQKQSVYLGAATTNRRDWTATGQQIVLNSHDYPSTVNATFEAGLSIIGGEAAARLINKTTGAIISASEVSHSVSATTWKTSNRFKLHPGSNIYEVELRSTSDEVAQLAGARIVIE